MSSTYSAESAGSASGSNGLECEQSHSAKSMTIAAASCESTGLMCQTSETFGSSNSGKGSRKSFAAASLARISARRESAPDYQDRAAGFGESLQDSFAWLSRDTSSWKTSQTCLLGEWETFSEIWPNCGTMRNGVVFADGKSDCLTIDRGSSLLPTVTVKGNYNRVGASATSGDGVATSVKRLTGFYPAAEFCEVMMGFPPGWTELLAVEMPSSRKSRKQSGGK